jgi:hypothetical protein
VRAPVASSRAPPYPWWALARVTASVAGPGWLYGRARVGRPHRYTVLGELRPTTALCNPRRTPVYRQFRMSCWCWCHLRTGSSVVVVVFGVAGPRRPSSLGRVSRYGCIVGRGRPGEWLTEFLETGRSRQGDHRGGVQREVIGSVSYQARRQVGSVYFAACGSRRGRGHVQRSRGGSGS